VVFDCAARYKGKSLNDQLLRGPDLMSQLVGVLSRFRKDKIAVVSDIEAMFHQVKVDPKDHSYLRFLWWPDGNFARPSDEYCMQVHLFGATSSPSCANFCLQSAADDQANQFDAAAVETVKRNFYMDDCLRSVATEAEAVSLVHQLVALLKNCGFRLTKWLSNSKEVLSAIPEEDVSDAAWNLDPGDQTCERVLGVRWNYEADNFQFNVKMKEKPFTRRGILSVVASLFDPLGFVSPVILGAKILLQDLCRRKLSWDDAISPEDTELWKKWLGELPLLCQVKIKRCLMPPECKFDTALVELHHFSDASMKAYGVVSYLRVVGVNGNPYCSFLFGKSRLAPLKTVSIPRLELMAATLAVKIDQLLRTEMDLVDCRSCFWSDSTAVLHMINNSAKRFPTFVANRLTKIDAGSEPKQWRYIDTKCNPADDASRGLTAAGILNSRWFLGPKFLWKTEDSWPENLCSFGDLPPEFEILKNAEVSVNLTTSSNYEFVNRFQRFSSWKRLRAAIAWLLRLGAIRRKQQVPKGSLTVDELEAAEVEILKHVQQSAFSDVIDAVQKNAFCKKGKDLSSLRKLNPILFSGLLRVGGRLRRAPVTSDTKHPVILPASSHVTRLIIEDYHLQVGHSGMAGTWTALRQNYWVIRGAATVRKVLGKCLFCKRRNAKVGKQFMADLPKERVMPDKPVFHATGIDFFGPFYVKEGRRNVKRYGCLFTCLTSRAVHIEITPSLNADAFINALRRFVCRRGFPYCFYSDNGTNIAGGYRELKESLQKLDSAKVETHLRQQKIRWHFNPPYASHFGGVWERMIRSVRRIFNALLSQQTLTDDSLLTLMTEVESILNSRPLTPILLDPEAEEPLTPNHLLLLRSSSSVPGIFEKSDNYCRNKWRQVQYFVQQFWIRWRREFLQTLQVRNKWQKVQSNFAVDDVVLLYDDSAPRGKWPLGRIVEVYPDKQGRIRQVLVRTTTQTLRRPISKLCQSTNHLH